MPPGQQVDHRTDSGARRLHQVRTDSRGHVVALLIEMARDGADGSEARKCQRQLLDQFEPQCHSHRTFDGRAADLAVPLRRMRVSDRKQSAGHFDRQEKFRAQRHVAHIHVAAHPARRNDAVQARFRGRHADGARERLERNFAPAAEHGGRQCLRIVLPKVQCRFLEFAGQQTESRNIRRPAPAGRGERQERHLEHIAGACAVDENRSAHRIDLGEVQPSNIGHRRGRTQLASRGIDGVELQRLAGCDAHRGPEAVVPAEMMLVDGVLMAHGAAL